MIISKEGFLQGLKGTEIQKYSDVYKQIYDAKDLFEKDNFNFNTAKQAGITNEVYQYIEATDRATVSTEGFYEAITKNSHGLVNATQLMNSYNKISKQDSETKQAFINGLAKNNVDLANNIDKAAKTGGVATLGIKNFLKSIASSLGTGLLDIGLSFAVGAAINLISVAADKIIETQEEKIQAAKELAEKHTQAVDETTSNLESIEGYKSEFERLSKGVDNLGNNVSLTADEYKRYKELVSNIIEVNPALVKGYNAEGEAIINKNEAIERTIELLQKQRDLENKEFTSNENLETTFKPLQKQIKEIEKAIKNIKEKNMGKRLDPIESAIRDYSDIEKNEIYGASSFVNSKDRNPFLKEYFDSNKSDYERAQHILDNWEDFYSRYQKLMKQLYGREVVSSEELYIQIKKPIDDLAYYEQQLRSTTSSYTESLKLYASTLPNYDKLSSAGQAIVSGYIGEIDFQKLVDESNLSQAILAAKIDINNLIEEIFNDPDLAIILDPVMSLDTSSMTYDEYKELLDTSFNEASLTDFAKRYGYENPDKFKLALGFAFEDDDGKIVDTIEQQYNSMLQHVWKTFGETNSDSILELQEIISSIPVDRISDVDNALINIDSYEFRSFRDLVDSVLGLRTFGAFNPEEWFNDDEATNSKGINTIVSEMDTLLSALDTLNAGEELDVTWFKDFPELLEYADDTELLKIKIQELASQKPEGIINELIKLKDSLVDEKDIEAVQNLIDLLSRKYTNSAFDDIVEQSEKTETQMNSLQSALDSLVNGDPLEVTWFEDFPDLAKYAGDTKALQEAITEKLSDLPEKMLRTIEKYKKENQEVLTVQEKERLTAIEIMLIQAKITNERKVQTNLITEQKNKAEEELEILNKQRDALEETISQYESAANAIINAIDDEIEKLEEGKAAIEEKYNAEIEALQKENEERDRSNALREKELALEKAKNDKVRVYSAARGWTIQTNSEAVKTAQKEYDDQVNSNKIAELEEQRDAETKVFDERIKEYEDYKEMWQDALNEYQNMQDEMNAAALFGANWRTIAIGRDVSAISSFVSSYGFYQEQLNQMVNPEIERIQSEIDKYNEKIDALDRLQQAEEDYFEHYKNYIAELPIMAVSDSVATGAEAIVESAQNGNGFKFLQGAETTSEAMTKFNNFMNSGSPASLLGGASPTNLRIASGFKGVVDTMVGNHAANVITQKSGNVINNQYGWTITGNEINADKYETFKGYMDRYVREAQMNLSVGKR